MKLWVSRAPWGGNLRDFDTVEEVRDFLQSMRPGEELDEVTLEITGHPDQVLALLAIPDLADLWDSARLRAE